MTRLAPLILLLAIALGGCGQKGPLYQPDDTTSERHDATTPPGAADEKGS